MRVDYVGRVIIDSLPIKSSIFLIMSMLKCRYIIDLVRKFRFPFTKANSTESNRV